MRMGCAAVAGVAMVLLTGGCGVHDDHRPYFHDQSNETPEFQSDRIEDDMDDDSVADFLLPEEREALRRSAMTGIRVDPPASVVGPPVPPKTGFAGFLDKMGKVGVSLMSVAVTIGAAVAPFFLF